MPCDKNTNDIDYFTNLQFPNSLKDSDVESADSYLNKVIEDGIPTAHQLVKNGEVS